MANIDETDDLIVSERSGAFLVEGVRIEVNICTMDPVEGWSLEVVNQHGTSTVWDDLFATEEDAWDAFVGTVDEEGAQAFFVEDEPLDRLN